MYIYIYMVFVQSRSLWETKWSTKKPNTWHSLDIGKPSPSWRGLDHVFIETHGVFWDLQVFIKLGIAGYIWV